MQLRTINTAGGAGVKMVGATPTRLPRSLRPLSTQSGAAMIFVLVVTTILLSGAIWATSTHRAGVRATGQLLDKLKARVAAESAFQVLQYYGATGRVTATSMGNALPEKFGFPTSFPLYGATTRIQFGENRELAVAMQDLGGRLNVVVEGKKIFARLLLIAGASHAEVVTITDSLDDWMDTNDLHHPNGAERYYYRHQRKGEFEPRNSIYLQHPAELSLIRGMKKEYIDTILPYITTAPLRGFSVPAMPAVMLAATLNCTVEEAERILALRRVKGRLDRADIKAVLGRNTAVAFSGMGFPARVVDITVVATVGDAGSEVGGTISFLEDDYAPFRVLTWQEGR